MNFDPSVLIPYVSLFISCVVAFGYIKDWINGGEKQMRKDVDNHASKITNHDRRIQTLENEIKHLPDRESQHRMELQLSELNGSFRTLEEKLKPIAATSERLHELLMEQAKR